MAGSPGQIQRRASFSSMVRTADLLPNAPVRSPKPPSCRWTIRFRWSGSRRPKLRGILGRLLDEARTVPMFSPRRLLWVRNAAAQKAVSDDVKALIADPPRDAIVLIEAGELKKGAPLRTAVEAGSIAMALPCYSDAGRDLDLVIDSDLERVGMTIACEARQALQRNLGGDRHGFSRRDRQAAALRAWTARNYSRRRAGNDGRCFCPFGGRCRRCAA